MARYEVLEAGLGTVGSGAQADILFEMGMMYATGRDCSVDLVAAHKWFNIAAIKGVSEVYSVTGEIDLIALVRVRSHEEIAAVVADKLNKVDGVVATETHVAFRAYSKHDLEAAFAIGD